MADTSFLLTPVTTHHSSRVPICQKHGHGCGQLGNRWSPGIKQLLPLDAYVSDAFEVAKFFFGLLQLFFVSSFFILAAAITALTAADKPVLPPIVSITLWGSSSSGVKLPNS